MTGLCWRVPEEALRGELGQLCLLCEVRVLSVGRSQGIDPKRRKTATGPPEALARRAAGCQAAEWPTEATAGHRTAELTAECPL
jgi:hypothetical protein